MLFINNEKKIKKEKRLNDFKNIQTSLLPFDQTEIEATLKQLLYDKGFSDVLYEGSNISQIANVVSYMIGVLNVNTSINLQETILPLASKRQNILFGARQLGYEPHQLVSYKYNLTIKPKYDTSKTITDSEGNTYIDIENTETRVLEIPRYTQFYSDDRYYFYIDSETKRVEVSNWMITHMFDTDSGVNPEDVLIKLEIIEGKLTPHTEDEALQFVAYDYLDENGETKTQQQYLVPYKNVENQNGLMVFLEYIDDNGEVQVQEYTRAENFILDETLNYNKNKYIRKENIILGFPEIYFEFAGFGNKIRSGTTVRIDVLQSTGAGGYIKGELHFANSEASELFEIIDIELSRYGSDWEDDEKIKENAIVYHNTANRAVTREDYVTISKQYSEVKESDFWGGEDELYYYIDDPASPNPITKPIGNIFGSCTPSEKTKPIVAYTNGFKIDTGKPTWISENQLQQNLNNWYLSDTLYDNLFEYLDNFKIVTMKLNKRQPLYLDFYYTIDIVKYDATRSVYDVHQDVFNALNNYFVSTLEKFEVEYIQSNVQRVLDKVLGNNSGLNIGTTVKGVLFEDMIDNHYQEFNREVIIVSLGYPFEKFVHTDDDGKVTIDLDYIPFIDTTEFGYSQGSLSVLYDELNDSNINPYNIPIKQASIKYNDGTNTYDFGKYVIDTYKNRIELIFDFSNVSKETIFGTQGTPEDPNANKVYAYFDILYYPHDNQSYNTILNMPVAKHSIPRLKQVDFILN